MVAVLVDDSLVPGWPSCQARFLAKLSTAVTEPLRSRKEITLTRCRRDFVGQRGAREAHIRTDL